MSRRIISHAHAHKFKMAAYSPDVTRISRYEWDISELPGETAIFEVQKHGIYIGLVGTLSYTSGWVIYQR